MTVRSRKTRRRTIMVGLSEAQSILTVSRVGHTLCRPMLGRREGLRPLRGLGLRGTTNRAAKSEQGELGGTSEELLYEKDNHHSSRMLTD